MKAARRAVCLMLALWGACVPLTGKSASDRGIGGTGGPASGPQISDRGIGGTGIAGVITGFGSVIVNGLEIAYAPSTPLTVDGVPDTQAQLLVGQFAAIVASDDHGLHADSIEVRHEVSGPVTSVGADSGTGGRMLIVAGQRVAVSADTEGLQTFRPGDWIAVSGLRQSDGVIAASRVDQREPGTVLVRGPAMASAGGWQIGDLRVQPPPGTSVAPGESISAQGTIVDGRLSATTATPDVLGSDPGAFFGNHVRRMVIESYVSAAGGHVRLGRGLLATTAPGVAVPIGGHRAIVELERGAHGGFIATHLRGVGRPVAPHRAAPHQFGPPYNRQHSWQDHYPGFRHAGGSEPRRGCVRCGRNYRRQ